jgi:hypothetical protein
MPPLEWTLHESRYHDRERYRTHVKGWSITIYRFPEYWRWTIFSPDRASCLRKGQSNSLAEAQAAVTPIADIIVEASTLGPTCHETLTRLADQNDYERIADIVLIIFLFMLPDDRAAFVNEMLDAGGSYEQLARVLLGTQ